MSKQKLTITNIQAKLQILRNFPDSTIFPFVMVVYIQDCYRQGKSGNFKKKILS